jgi:hypothetical protein
VLGPFLKAASQQEKVHVIHTIPDELLPSYKVGTNGNVGWHSLIPLQDRIFPFVLRKSLTYAHMYWVNNFPMRRNCRRGIRGSWRTKAAGNLARLIGRSCATPRRIRVLDRLHDMATYRLPEVDHYKRLFREIRPRIVICSNQRPTQVVPAVMAAKSLGIPTATFIFSWDNLCSKGRIAAPFDHFLVWSDCMRRELLRYYPDVTDGHVHIVGTPQFDPYGDKNLLWTRDEFFHRIGASPRQPLICFSGGTTGNAREDPNHLAVLMQHIRSGRIKGNPQVLLRPSPSDLGTRFDRVRADHPELLYAQPQCHQIQPGNWAAVIPTCDDVQFLANLTHHADLNINFVSTMTLDFAIHDKPIINLAFDVTNPPHFDMPMWDYYQLWDHYRPVIELGAARFARSASELAEHVNAYLDNPSLDREGRRRFAQLELGVPIGQCSQRTIDVINQLACGEAHNGKCSMPPSSSAHI